MGWEVGLPPEIAGLGELEEIGRGGFGIVYRAHDPAHGRAVAVKVLRQNLDQGGLARFERECRAAGALSGHPNIVSIHGSGVTGTGDPYLVMDLLPGGSLAERVRATGPLTPEAALSLGTGLAGALSAAHAKGIVHRDVKPENVLFSAFGLAHLVDFGIARMASEFETRSGSISASLSHAPPEVIAGTPPTPAGDVYSLASVLHFALSGHAPFDQEGEASLAPLLARISTAAPPDLRTIDVPDALASVVASGLAKDPADRPPTAAAFGRALQGAASQLGMAVPTLVTGAPEDEGTDALVATPGATGEPETHPSTTPRRRAKRIVPAAAAVMAAGLTAIGLFAAFGPGDDGGSTPPTTRSAGTATFTTTAGPAQVPEAPTHVLARNPIYLGADAARVSVELSWETPPGVAQQDISEYRIRRAQHWSDACGTPAGADQPIQVSVFVYWVDFSAGSTDT